jgi:hypothetical protein
MWSTGITVQMVIFSPSQGRRLVNAIWAGEWD